MIVEKFGISIPRAQRMLRLTTLRGVRSAILPIIRRYRSDCMFSVKQLSGKLATDTAHGKIKSFRGNVGSQVFSHKCGFKPCKDSFHGCDLAIRNLGSHLWPKETEREPLRARDTQTQEKMVLIHAKNGSPAWSLGLRITWVLETDIDCATCQNAQRDGLHSR
jgi:hypothetical protein